MLLQVMPVHFIVDVAVTPSVLLRPRPSNGPAVYAAFKLLSLPLLGLPEPISPARRRLGMLRLSGKYARRIRSRTGIDGWRAREMILRARFPTPSETDEGIVLPCYPSAGPQNQSRDCRSPFVLGTRGRRLRDIQGQKGQKVCELHTDLINPTG